MLAFVNSGRAKAKMLLRVQVLRHMRQDTPDRVPGEAEQGRVPNAARKGQLCRVHARWFLPADQGMHVQPSKSPSAHT
jgi:hypothetical protein